MKKQLMSKILTSVCCFYVAGHMTPMGDALCAKALAAAYTNTITQSTELNDGDTINVSGNTKDTIMSIKANSVYNNTVMDVITVNGNVSLSAKNSQGSATGINVSGKNCLQINNDGKLTIDVDGATNAYGIDIYAQREPAFTVMPDIEITVKNNSADMDVIGINNSGNSVFNGKVKVEVITDYDVPRASAVNNDAGKMVFNDDVELSTQTTSDLTDSLIGYVACVDTTSYNNSMAMTTFNGKAQISINGNAQTNYILGVTSLFGNNEDNLTNVVFNDDVSINAENKNGVAAAVFTQEFGKVKMSAKTELSAQGIDDANSLAIYNDIASTVDISKTEGSSAAIDAVQVRITGNIVSQNAGFNASEETYAGKFSKLNINATGAGSFINGWIDNDAASSETTLALHDGAAWNNSGESSISELVMDDGVLTQRSEDDITIEKYSGSGQVLFNGASDAGALTVSGGKVIVEQAEAASEMHISVANPDEIDTLDSSRAEAALNALAEKIKYEANGKDENLSGSVKLDEGLLTPEVSGVLKFKDDKHGYVTDITYKTDDSGDMGKPTETSTMAAMRNIASSAIIGWRQEDSTLGQRLGELRASESGQGIWARMSRGEFEYGGEYKNQYNYLQMGYDKAHGAWHYGAAVSHNDGDTSYADGRAENRSTSLSLYGTWLGEGGHYADIVLKRGRLSVDYDIYAAAGHSHGEYDTWGTSLSGEYGRKIKLGKGWFVTPQAQLSLMRVSGEDYTTSSNIRVHQDALDSALGRVGLELGKDFSDRGGAYFKASYLHEFAGAARTGLTLGKINNYYEADIGGSWWETGIGFNYKTSDESYIYADIVKTFGDNFRTPWQWNVGIRYSF